MRASVLAALALGSSIVPVAASQEASRPAVQFKAFCTFEREQSGLSLWEEGTARDELRRHAYAHGWSWEITAPDLVSGANAARCPDRILQQMTQAHALSDVFLYHDMALALERNNGLDSALGLLSRALEEEHTKEPDQISDLHSAFLSEWAAKLAAHSSDWVRALEFAEGWHPTSTCGNAAWGERADIDAFNGRCLAASGRFAEATGIARRTAQTSWSRSTGMIELWLDCEINAGRARIVDEAMNNVLSMVPEDAVEDCKRARDDWELARAPKSTQVERLNELARSHPELALPLLLTLDEAELSKQMGAFELVERDVRDLELASLLVELGLPQVGERLGQIKDASYSTEFLFDQWKSCNIRWKLLTGGS